MSRKLMAVLALNNVVLGGALFYLHGLITENNRVLGVVVTGMAKALSLTYENQFYVQQIIAFLTR